MKTKPITNLLIAAAILGGGIAYARDATPSLNLPKGFELNADSKDGGEMSCVNRQIQALAPYWKDYIQAWLKLPGAGHVVLESTSSAVNAAMTDLGENTYFGSTTEPLTTPDGRPDFNAIFDVPSTPRIEISSHGNLLLIEYQYDDSNKTCVPLSQPLAGLKDAFSTYDAAVRATEAQEAAKQAAQQADANAVAQTNQLLSQLNSEPASPPASQTSQNKKKAGFVAWIESPFSGASAPKACGTAAQ